MTRRGLWIGWVLAGLGVICLYSPEALAAAGEDRDYNVAVTEALDRFEAGRIRRFHGGRLQNAPKAVDEPRAPRRIPLPKKVMLDVLEFKNVDIMDVLKVIAGKSGLNIVAGRGVSGKVTIYLRNVEVRDALRIILEAHNLAFAEEDGILRVMTAKDFQLKYGKKFGEDLQTSIVQLVYADATVVNSVLVQMKSVLGKVIVDKSSNALILIDTPQRVRMLEQLILGMDTPRQTQVFELYYAKAEDLAAKISGVLTANVGRVEIDPRSNKLIVTDSPEKILRVEQMIRALDDREPEVFIEAKILQVALRDEYKLGIDWEALAPGYHDLSFRTDMDILDTSDKRGVMNIGTLSRDRYTALLEGLRTIGTTNILSNPRISVMNNQEAKILVGSTEPYITSTTVTPSSGPTTTSESVNFIEVGVKLYVTPTVHKSGFVTMKIKPEVSSVVRSVTTSNNNTIPVVETSEAETTVMVKDGVTIVIGGLIKDEAIKTEKKVPVLGEIPVVGRAFQSRDHFKRKTELVIFLTPHIITGDVDEGSQEGAWKVNH